MKRSEYHFKSTWNSTAHLPVAEQAILDMEGWKQWWSGMVAARTIRHQRAVVGSVVTATWKSMFGYRLAMQLTIIGYVPGQQITFRSSGDLEGEGSWTFRVTSDGGTQMDILWNVTTQKTWMNVLAPFLRPLFVGAHNKLMEQGERGLRRYLAQK